MHRDRGLSSHLGERPSGHRGSGPHPLHPGPLALWHPGTLAPWLHPGTHQQARRLLGHPLQLGSPPLIGPHTSVSILKPAHLFRSDGFAVLRNNLCWRAGVLRPLWWTPGNWTKQRARWYRTHTPEIWIVTVERTRQRRQQDTCHDSYVWGNAVQPCERRTYGMLSLLV